MSAQANRRSKDPSALAWANLAIAIVVWLLGLGFTRQMVPFVGIGDFLPWLVAAGIQFALSVGQTNQRSIGWRNLQWPYIVLIAIDIGLNSLGLLITSGTVQTPGDALLYVLRTLTTGQGSWQVATAIAIGALVAALPEQLLRDAAGGSNDTRRATGN